MMFFALFVFMWGVADIVRQRRIALEEKTRYVLFAVRDRLRNTSFSEEDRLLFQQMDETCSRTIRALPNLSLLALLATMVDLKRNADEIRKLSALISDMSRREHFNAVFAAYVDAVDRYLMARNRILSYLLMVWGLLQVKRLASQHPSQEFAHRTAQYLLRNANTSAFVL